MKTYTNEGILKGWMNENEDTLIYFINTGLIKALIRKK